MTKIKICGLSTPETLMTAVDHGADFIGLVFYPPSPRNVSLVDGAKLADMARGKAQIVALTVDADDPLIDDIVTHIKPDFIQAHGNETPARLHDITARTGIKAIKAIKLRNSSDLASADGYQDAAAFMLYDAKPPASLANALPGGNGISFDWKILNGMAEKADFMLSGGLDIDNITTAIATTKAAMVDVSSGVESAPGIKDQGLIKRFIKQVRPE